MSEYDISKAQWICVKKKVLYIIKVIIIMSIIIRQQSTQLSKKQQQQKEHSFQFDLPTVTDTTFKSEKCLQKWH